MRSNTCILENYDSECIDLILLVSGTSLQTNNEQNNNNNNNYHKLCLSTPPPPPSSPLLNNNNNNFKKDNSFLDLSKILDKNFDQDIIINNSEDDIISKNNNNDDKKKINKKLIKKSGLTYFKRQSKINLKPFLNLNSIIVSNVSQFNQ